MESFKPFWARLFLFLGILILAYSCGKNDEVPSENEILKNQLIGIWDIPNYSTIYFNENSEVIDSNFAFFNDINKVHYITKANYRVENEQIKLSNSELLSTIGQEENSVSVFITSFLPLYNIEIHNDTLKMEGVSILYRDSDKAIEFKGIWETENLFSAYAKDSSVTNFGGIRKEIYNFREDSNIVDYNFSYIYNSELFYKQEGKVSYYYNNDILKINYWNYNYTVSFSEDKMYWTSRNKKELVKRQSN